MVEGKAVEERGQAQDRPIGTGPDGYGFAVGTRPELRPGQERDFALGLVSQVAQPMGMAPSGAVPMTSSYTAPTGMNPFHRDRIPG